MDDNPQPGQYKDLYPEEEQLQCVLVLFEVRRGKQILEMNKGIFKVGRDESTCDVILDPLDRSASREHFSVEKRSGHHHLVNLSSNGTFVNGEIIGSKGRRLYHGDVIEAGNSELTFLLPEYGGRTAQELMDDGMQRETLEPAYSIQCYALVLREQPDNIECAARLLALLSRQERYEELATGSNYFDLQKMMRLAKHPRIAAPLVEAFYKVGDFYTAMSLVDLAGGPSVNHELASLTRAIEKQTGGCLLSTIRDEPKEPSFFQRGSLKVYLDEREDYGDLRYIERYYKYICQRIDPLFGGPVGSLVEFHITIRDQLFAQSMPNQSEILGYYSPASHRIFIRPRRWMEGKARDEDFSVVLLHEYVHLRVHAACGSKPPPRWYNEGLAQLFSEEGRAANVALLGDARTRFRELMRLTDDCFSTAQGDPTWAYLQSASLLCYLAGKFDKEDLVAVLTSMGASGKIFAQAFNENPNFSLTDLDREWWKYIEPGRKNSFPIVIDGGK